MKYVSRTLMITMLLILVAALAIPGLTQAEEETERVLVQFKAPQATGRGSIQGAHLQNAEIHHDFSQLNMMALSLPASQVDALRNDPSVLSVQPDAPRYLTDEVVPYGVDSVQGRDLWDGNHDGVVDPGAPDGSGRLVCIIDSGVNAAHEDFAGVNFVGGFPANAWNSDGCGHGTHVAGTIAAMSNGTGVVGVSPGAVNLYIVRIYGDNCGWAYVSDLVSAAFKCRDAGANIINMSLGGYIGGGVEQMIFDMLYHDYGILSIASAGNDGSSGYQYPASYNSVISVAAVDQNNNVAGFSQKNNQIELAAPGVGILSTSNTGGYVYMNGTSMAAPHVTAAAALVWSGDDTKTNAQIRQALQSSALDLGAAGTDDASGFGLIRSKAAYDSLNGSPTAVQIAGFDAQAGNGSILLEWETAAEVDVIGFNLYRAETSDGPETQLNQSLIASQSPGNPVGAQYSFVDEAIAYGTTYHYWLEAVSSAGDSTRHGPATASALNAGTYRMFIPMVYR